jgi:hypothetical protein
MMLMLTDENIATNASIAQKKEKEKKKKTC